MAFDFESLKAKVTELTNTGVNKAKELTEIGKLKVQNVSEQDEIRKAYMAMGNWNSIKVICMVSGFGRCIEEHEITADESGKAILEAE